VLVLDSILSVAAPVVASGDHQPSSELRSALKGLAGRCEERVQHWLGDGCGRVEELALDSRQLTGVASASHEVDTRVTTSATLRVLGPHPHLVVELRVLRLRREVCLHESLK